MNSTARKKDEENKQEASMCKER